MEPKKLREQIFRHLDGVVTVPVVNALYSKGVLAHILEHTQVEIDDLTKCFDANKGYLNVALRVLASQGFLDYNVDNTAEKIFIKVNSKTSSLIDSISWYQLVKPLLTSYNVEDFMGDFADENHHVFTVINYYLEKKNKVSVDDASPEYQFMKHIEGYLISPMIVKLAMSGMFHKYFMESSFSAEEFHKRPEVFKRILEFFVELGWFNKINGHYQFTEEGLFFAKRATSYGVTVSYLPIFHNLENILFGKSNALRDIDNQEDEIHVDRAMNVWGSGGAHATYFKVIDDFVIEIFNQPLDKQPKGILDMGCGNGALLQHLYHTIERYTLRGKHLDEYPLFLVGADYNQAALKITRANLIANDIWAKVIWGDIGNPDQLAHDLKENYSIALSDLLNMRTFLDHNRVWEEPSTTLSQPSTSTGAFVHRGQWLPNHKVEASLKEHLSKWKPYISKNGLIVIELHTVAPKITSDNIGKTPATAYDATHGFSDQYILEIDVFQRIARESGLEIDEQLFKKYPDTAYATVSINYFK